MNIEGKTFSTKQDLIKYLHENKQEIKEMKKAAIKHTDGALTPITPGAAPIHAMKALSTSNRASRCASK